VTYDAFSARWPQIKGDKYFDRINSLKKLVASTTLKDVTWNASVISGEVGATLRALKEQSGGTIMKYGVSQLDRTLLANKLVDEYGLWIVPTVVRQGKRAFEDVGPSLPKLFFAGCVSTANSDLPSPRRCRRFPRLVPSSGEYNKSRRAFT
jgi:dihydrofolate reductase